MIGFTGCGTALVTPFRDGEVDWQSYEALVRRQVSSGVDFLVPLGTTAETPCLTDEEKVRLLSITRQLSGGKPILVGVGSNSPAGTFRNMELLSDADGYLVVVPFYNKPTQEGLYRYFETVAQKSDKPIVLYNVPGRTGTNMLAQTTLRLARNPKIVAVKEASGNVDQVLEIVRCAPEGFSVLSGNDDQTKVLMDGGAHGLISVASNIAPDLVSGLVHAIAQGRTEEAQQLEEKLHPLFKACTLESNPIPVKCGLSVMGLCTSEMRLPLTPATGSTLEAMKQVIGSL